MLFAAGGRGRVAIDFFCREGAKVVASDFKEPDAELTELLKHHEVTYIKAGATGEQQIKNLVVGTIEKYGKIDVLN